VGNDILGHDHLDHGRHLPHTNPQWKPGERMNRGSLPQHVALRPKRFREPTEDEREHQANAYAHLHQRRDHTAHADTAHLGNEPAQQRAKPTIVKELASSKLLVSLGIMLFGALLITVFARTAPAFTAFLTFLIINTVIEYHKYFTQGIPLDLEILIVGVATMTLLYGAAWGVALALLGPLTAAAARGHICQAAARKTAALVVVVVAASILNPTRFELLFAVLIGVFAHYATIVMSGASNGMVTLLARASTLGINSYVALFVVPALTSIA
jgi:hypothetical protein